MLSSHLVRFLVSVLACSGIPVLAGVDTCHVEKVADLAGAFTIHLSAGCTEKEREARAVQAAHILSALTQGKSIDLSGVVIQGDLRLDDLPLGMFPIELPSVEIEDAVRVVPGAFSVMNSIVRGAIRHESSRHRLVMNGPVTMSGTRFEQTVDLSRAIFAQPVTLSGAIFLKESYFVQARFLREVFAEKTAFGPHARFHLSQFHGPVTFKQSGFNGLAEFLEVEFEQDADFSQTYFKSGTGFSGSRFRGPADFSEALFDREAFFSFTRFDRDVFFRRATFRSTANFDDAEFKARDDFSKVLFEGDAGFARVKRPVNAPAGLGVENTQVQYAITLSLLVFSVLLIAYLIRSR